jgi:hypothetical protein
MPFLLVALLITAAVLYLAWRGSNGGGRPTATAVRPKPKPVAPDDDLDFLSEIDRKLRGEDKSS